MSIVKNILSNGGVESEAKFLRETVCFSLVCYEPYQKRMGRMYRK
jgi:hypothetical protein